MQRYSIFEWDVKQASEPFVEEVVAWMEGDAEAEAIRAKSGVRPGEENIKDQARNAGLLMPSDL